MTAILELDHVWKSFRGVDALRDVSFAINPGEVVCLLGDNGAGKSTLVKIMSGVHSPDRGRVLVSGQPVTRWSPKNSRRAGIETIYQDKALAPRQTVARNIFMGRELLNRLRTDIGPASRPLKPTRCCVASASRRRFST